MFKRKQLWAVLLAAVLVLAAVIPVIANQSENPDSYNLTVEENGYFCCNDVNCVLVDNYLVFYQPEDQFQYLEDILPYLRDNVFGLPLFPCKARDAVNALLTDEYVNEILSYLAGMRSEDMTDHHVIGSLPVCEVCPETTSVITVMFVTCEYTNNSYFLDFFTCDGCWGVLDYIAVRPFYFTGYGYDIDGVISPMQAGPRCVPCNSVFFDVSTLAVNAGSNATHCYRILFYDVLNCRQCGNLVTSILNRIQNGPTHNWTAASSQHIRHMTVHPNNCQRITTSWERCSRSCGVANRNVRETTTTFWCLSPFGRESCCPYYEDEY